MHSVFSELDDFAQFNAFIESVFNFPTLSEAYKYAAYDGLGNVARERANRVWRRSDQRRSLSSGATPTKSTR